LINQAQCRFRTDEKSQSVIYKPFDIKSYYCTDGGLYYISKTIEIDSVKINTFIEILVKGVMNLYYYVHKTDKYDNDEYYQFQGVVAYYFFEDEAGKMHPVSKKPDKILTNNRIQNDNSYRYRTISVLRDAPNISQDIKNLQYDQKSFIKITKDYHNAVCTDGQQCIIYQNLNPDKFGYIVQISPFIGYNFYNFMYTFHYYIVGTTLYTKLNVNSSFPTLGVEMKIVNPRWTKLIGFQAELSVSQLPIAEITSSLKRQSYEYYTIPVKIEASNAMYGKFKFGLMGAYPKYKFQPIVGYGLYTSKLFGRNRNNYLDLGGSLTLGADYALNARHHLIFRINYDKLLSGMVYDEVVVDTEPNLFYKDNIKSVCSAKIGYSF